MGSAGGVRAPTVVIETIVVVRPIKVLGVMCGVVAVLLFMLNVAASAWTSADGQREGLWERCLYNQTRPDFLHCGLAHERAWRTACQALTITALILTILAIIVTSVGLRTVNFRVKYKLYWAGLVIFFLAVGIQLISLIVFPIKFLDEPPNIDNRDDGDWAFGWTYVIGWCAAVCDFAAGLFLLLDRGAEEILYKERVMQDDERNGIEASEDV